MGSPFSFAHLCILRIVPATMLCPNSGVSCLAYHRRTKFFISHNIQNKSFWALIITSFGGKVTVLSATFIKRTPHFLDAKHVCHLNSLLFLIVSIMDSVNP